MGDEQGQLVGHRSGVVSRLGRRDLGTDDDVADDPVAVGRRAGRRGVVGSADAVERERQHVGRTDRTHVLGVEGCDLIGVDQLQ